MENIEIIGVRKAIDKAGGPTELAEKLTKKHRLNPPMSRSKVHNWLYRGVPYQWLKSVESITGVKKETLR